MGNYTANTISVFLVQKETETRNMIKYKTNKQIKKKNKATANRSVRWLSKERALDAKLDEHGRWGGQTVISSPLTSKHDTCTHSYTYMHGCTKQTNEIFKTSNCQVEEPSIALLPV